MIEKDEPRDLLKTYFQQQGETFGKELWSSRSLELIENIETNDTELEIMNENDTNILEEFSSEISGCMKCVLGETRTNFVFGVGNKNADILFIGEAPGEKEDLLGEPFVGRAGKLLDKMLASIDLGREKAYIANILKCRPPKNRDPLPAEIELCEPYLVRQIELIAPKLIVALGRIAAKTLLRLDEPLGSMRSRKHNYHGIDVMVTYHPAALLRNPKLKHPAWEDLQEIRDNYLK